MKSIIVELIAGLYILTGIFSFCIDRNGLHLFFTGVALMILNTGDKE